MKIKELESLETPFELQYKIFFSYVNSLSYLPEQLKNIIIDRSFFDSNPRYYLYYPFLFAREGTISKERIEKLSIAGLLIYKSTLFKDDMLDKANVNIELFSLTTVLQEEAHKILLEEIGGDKFFWALWQKRKEEYYNGVKLDKTTDSINSISEFEYLCDLKSSIGKVGIDCLYYNSDIKEFELSELYLSHKYFYVAFQIIDDIADVEEDIINKQFNIAYHELLRETKIDNSDRNNFDQIKTYLYLSGIANRLKYKALLYLEKSEKIARSLDLPLWISEIQRLYNTIVSQILNTDGYILFSKRSNPKTYLSNRNDSISKAVEFIEEKQNKDGSWNEVLNTSGVSDVWSTAFILHFLSQKEVRTYLKFDKLMRGADFLEKQNGEWGYNQNWINDCDSTSFSLLALMGVTNTIPSLKYVEKFISNQSKNGGFTTYPNTKKLISSLNSSIIKDTGGWSKDHECVSSVALLFLTKLNLFKREKEMLFDWLVDKLVVNDLLGAYWWTSGLYSTSFFIKALLNQQNIDDKLVDKMIKRVLSFQNNDGSFGDSFRSQSPFYTGLVVDSVCEHENFAIGSHRSITRAVEWLRKNQFKDGSWASSYAMRIPHPSNYEPDGKLNWSVATIGTDIRSYDFNRLFSTSVALSALCKYEKSI